jgi:hypothetical protein
MRVEAVGWPAVSERLAPERSYWLGTVSPDGAPHASPVWGVVVEADWHFYSERSTVKARNLAANPRVVIHLGDVEDVVVVRGEVRDLGHPKDLPHVLDAFAAKYNRPDDLAFLPQADPAFDVMYALRPTSAMLWRLADFDGSQRRWRRD